MNRLTANAIGVFAGTSICAGHTIEPNQAPTAAGYRIYSTRGRAASLNLPSSTYSPEYFQSERLLNATTALPDVLAKEFRKLVKQWRDETFFLSSLTKMFAHPAYQRIMAMGKEGIPLVLREMQKSQDSWFYALKFMAGEDVAAGIKNFDDAKSAWLEWGYKHNYI